MPVDPTATAAVDSAASKGVPNFSSVRAPLPDERRASAGVVPMAFYEEGPHAGQVGADSTRVGFTVRDSRNKIQDAFAFRINPQGLSYQLGSRATLYATKSGVTIDDFGPTATVIVLRQTVIEGKQAYLGGPYYTGREDVQRFLKRIYLPATAGIGRKRLRVFFHDHHFERGFEQRVAFLPGSFLIERSVETPGVWRLELQMVSLEKYPYAEVEAEKTPQRTKSGSYQVKRGDTLEKIVRRLAGHGASAAKRKRVRAALLKLNPQLKKKRKVPGGKTGKPMHVYPGEVLAKP